MRSILVELPTLYYFKEKNKFSGSIDKLFRYKIIPADTLHCVIWHGLFAIDCIDQSEIVAQEDFELSDDGLNQLIDWIEAKYMEYLKANTQQ